VIAIGCHVDQEGEQRRVDELGDRRGGGEEREPATDAGRAAPDPEQSAEESRTHAGDARQSSRIDVRPRRRPAITPASIRRAFGTPDDSAGPEDLRLRADGAGFEGETGCRLTHHQDRRAIEQLRRKLAHLPETDHPRGC